MAYWQLIYLLRVVFSIAMSLYQRVTPQLNSLMIWLDLDLVEGWNVSDSPLVTSATEYACWKIPELNKMGF